MAVILGLCVAVTYGAADFMGGLASRRSPATTIVLLSQAVGLAESFVVALVVGWDAVTNRDALLAAGAGTVLLARVVLDEPIRRQRLAGLGLSVVALAFIAVP